MTTYQMDMGERPIVPIDDLPLPVALSAVPTGRFTALNRAAALEWGYDQATLTALMVSNVFREHPRFAGALDHLLHAGAGSVLACDAELVQGNGQVRSVTLRGLVVDADPEPVAMLVSIDSTFERDRERTLAADARRLRALIEANFDAYYDWHLDAGYHEWSAQFDALLGLPPGQSFPRHLEAWVDRLDPDEADNVVARLHRSVERGEPYVDEYRLRDDAGNYRLISDRGIVLLDDAGRPSDLVGVMRDITDESLAQNALEESLALYRTLFEAETNPTIRTDASGLVVDANEAFLSFFGISRDEAQRQTAAQLFGPSATKVLDALRHADADEVEPRSFEASDLAGAHGKTLRISVVPCAVAGEPQFFWLGTDISDLQALTVALRESEESLQEQTRALQERAVALRVILQQGRQEREDLSASLQSNLDRLVEPMLDRLGRFLSNRPESAYVDAVRQTLRDICGSIQTDGEGPSQPVWQKAHLTPREQEVARLVQSGKTSDQVAEILHLSAATVNYHRKNIRRKLGLTGQAPRLTSILGVAPADEGAESQAGDEAPQASG